MFICNINSKQKSRHLPGFRKSRGTQNSLITMLKTWKSALDKGENTFVLFMDLKFYL